jgi:hypothetical protein
MLRLARRSYGLLLDAASLSMSLNIVFVSLSIGGRSTVNFYLLYASQPGDRRIKEPEIALMKMRSGLNNRLID